MFSNMLFVFTTASALTAGPARARQGPINSERSSFDAAENAVEDSHRTITAQAELAELSENPQEKLAADLD